MPLKIKADLKSTEVNVNDLTKSIDRRFTKDYVDFLNEAGWRLEKKFPSNNNHYSDLLENTDWKHNKTVIKSLKHYRRDLDALS